MLPVLFGRVKKNKKNRTECLSDSVQKVGPLLLSKQNVDPKKCQIEMESMTLLAFKSNRLKSI